MKKIFKLIALFAFSMLLNGSLHAKTYEVVTFDEIQEIRKGKTKSYITSKGETFSVGQTIKLGFAFRNEQYDYIIQSPLGGMAVYPLSNIAAGSEAKDLLDLDLMTKDEYNSLKTELTPIIREE